MHIFSLVEHMNYSCTTRAHNISTSVRCLGLFCEITSSFCAWTAKSLSLRGLPYSISLVKSRDHRGWMLRHEGHHQLQHIMQILVLQSIQWRKKVLEKQRAQLFFKTKRFLIKTNKSAVKAEFKQTAITEYNWGSDTRFKKISTRAGTSFCTSEIATSVRYKLIWQLKC